MTDIVLLKRGVCMQAVGDGSDNIEVDVASTNALMRQAADEIETMDRLLAKAADTLNAGQQDMDLGSEITKFRLARQARG